MANGNNVPAPSRTPGWLLPLGGLLLLLILVCCSSIFMSYSRVGNINIFSSSGGLSPEELAYAQAHGGALPPGSSGAGGSALGLLDAFGVKQNCKVGPWSDWSACDANCGTTAHRTRTRSVVTPAKNGGSCPYALTESDLCTGLPSCEVPALNGQYEPCDYTGVLDGAYCMATGTPISGGDCEHIKQQAALYGISFGQAGASGSGASGAQFAQATSTIALAAAGATLGPAAVLGAGIGAAVAVSEVDCGDIYFCPTGYRDTRVNKKCDKEATPKCPPGGYTWDWTRRMCIMPEHGPIGAPAPSPH